MTARITSGVMTGGRKGLAWRPNGAPQTAAYAHGDLFTFSAPGLPVKADRNPNDYHWNGSRLLATTFSDFGAGKPAENTSDAFKAAFNGIQPGTPGAFRSDWESFETAGNYNCGMKVRNGGPSRSGVYVERGLSADGLSVYGWSFNMPSWGPGQPFYFSCKFRHKWYAPDVNPPKIWRIFFKTLPGQDNFANIYLNQSGSGLGEQQFRAHQENPAFGSGLYIDSNNSNAPLGEWHRLEAIGDPVNGVFRFYVNGVELHDLDRPGDRIPYQPEIDFSGEPVTMPNTYNGQGGNENNLLYTPGVIDFTDVLIDSDRHRVELANSATWGEHTISEPQIPVSCSDVGGTVTWGVLLNQGEHPTLNGLTIHLIDNYTNASIYSGSLA